MRKQQAPPPSDSSHMALGPCSQLFAALLPLETSFFSLSLSPLQAVMKKNGWLYFSCMTVILGTCHMSGCVRGVGGREGLGNAGLEPRDVTAAASGSPFHSFPLCRNVRALQVRVNVLQYSL